MTDTKQGPGRPKVSPEDTLRERQKVRNSLWTPNLRPVQGATDELPTVWIPDPPKGKGKQTTQYKAWAMECFLELVRHGYNFTQAAERIGYDYQWWSRNRKRDPIWEAEVLEAAKGTPMTDLPDLTKMDFATFVEQYGGFTLAEHQKWIRDALADPMGRLVLILGHPESGKSTLVSLWYVLYRIAQDPNIRIAIVSKSSSKAQDLLTRVKRYLTEPHLYEETPRNLIKDFNGFKPSHGDLQWSADQIYIRQRTSGERDPTVQALGIGKQIYGARLDLLILDDALVLDNQTSELQRERLDSWFTNEARSRVQRGQTIVNGTRLFPFDLYGQWQKSWQDNRLFREVVIPAMQDEWTEDERVTWPEYWTLDGYDVYEDVNGEQLVTGYQPGMRDIRAEIMARDPDRWRLVYQQEPVEESENIFRTEHIKNAQELGGARRIGQVYENEVLFLGVDPAPSGRAAAVLLALDPETRVRTVVDLYVGSRLGATGIRNKLVLQFLEKYKDHGIAAVLIETNFAPTLMGDESFRSRVEGYGASLLPHRTLGRGSKRGSKWDEEYGIGAMSALFNTGLIAFPSAGPDDESQLQPLLDDMLTFPWADQQDALIALWIANGEASTGYRHRSIDQKTAMQRRNVPPIVRQRNRAS